MLLIEAGCLGTVLLGDLGLSVPYFLGLYALAFAGYVLAIGASTIISFKTVLVCGVLFRATVIFSTPSLSDDVFRYIWDGVVQLEGINPYRYAPNAASLDRIAYPEIRALVNHAELPTIYPPVAQFFFKFAAWISPEPWSIQLVIAAFDCLTVLFLAGLARSYDLSPVATLLFFWNPLVIVEGAGQGHIDLVGVGFLAIGLLYIRLHGYGRAGAALGLSALVKLMPVILLPAFWRWAAKARADEKSVLLAMVSTRAILVPVVFTLVVAAGYLPFADVGWGVVGSLGTYAAHWEFNGILYGVLRGLGVAGESARALLGGGLACVAGGVALSRVPPIQGAYYVIGAFLVMTPTLHPWYAVWIVPFLCFYGNRGWIALSGLIVLAYSVLVEYRTTGTWEEPEWVRWVVVGGSLVAWKGTEVLHRIRKGESPPG